MANEVTYNAYRNRRTGQVRTSSYVPYEKITDASGKVIKEIWRSLYTQDRNGKVTQLAPYVQKVIDYQTGKSQVYRTKKVGSRGRERVKLYYDSQVGFKYTPELLTPRATQIKNQIKSSKYLQNQLKREAAAKRQREIQEFASKMSGSLFQKQQALARFKKQKVNLSNYTPKQRQIIKEAERNIKKAQGREVYDYVPPTKQKGLKGLQQALSKKKGKALQSVQTSKSAPERIFKGIFVLGSLGLARGVVGVAQTIRDPVGWAKGWAYAIKHPKLTVQYLGEEFKTDPVGVIAEYYAYGKTLNLAGKGVSRSPVGRFAQEELFIRSQPKQIQPAVRAIIKSSKAQEKLNPHKIASLSKVDFLEVKSLNKVEAAALKKTLQQTDSVVFGSVASRTLSKKRTPLPKDVDLATANVKTFGQKFINNLPKSARKNYALKGEKLVNAKTGQALLDVKPLSRLVPQKNIVTKKGQLPVVGYVYKVSKKKGSVLPTLKKKPGVSTYTVPTQKFVKVDGIKLTGFGEQTTRKALGTLQVLIEKNPKRAKDPQSLLISLKVQKAALKQTKPLTPIGKISKASKLKNIDNAIKVLQSKEFSKLLDQKVPGLTREFPLVAKIPSKKAKSINLKKVNNAVKKQVKVTKPVGFQKQTKGGLKNVVKPKVKELPKVKSSVLPKAKIKSSYLPKARSSKLTASRITAASIIPASKIAASRIAKSRIPTSKTPASKIRASTVPKSKTPASVIAKSRIPKSKIPTSRIPKSKIPVSKIPPSTLRRIKSRFPLPMIKEIKKIPKNVLKLPKTKEEKEKINKWLKRQRPVYRPGLAAIIFEITSYEVPKSITGFEIRPILIKQKPVNFNRFLLKRSVKKVKRARKPTKRKRKR